MLSIWKNDIQGFAFFSFWVKAHWDTLPFSFSVIGKYNFCSFIFLELDEMCTSHWEETRWRPCSWKCILKVRMLRSLLILLSWYEWIYFYLQVSSWGGYVFLINLIPLHVLALMATGRFSHRIYVAYCSVSTTFNYNFCIKSMGIVLCWN